MTNNIKRIVELHGKIARRFKEYEHRTNSHPPIEVINEMRYALRAVVVILGSQNGFDTVESSDDEVVSDNAEERAIHALLCAYHDLADGLLIEITSYMEWVTKDYTSASITILGEKRAEILEFIQEVEKAMVVSRGNGLKRSAIYEEEIYDKFFAQLIAYKIEIEKDLLPKIVTLHEDIQRDSYRS